MIINLSYTSLPGWLPPSMSMIHFSYEIRNGFSDNEILSHLFVTLQCTSVSLSLS